VPATISTLPANGSYSWTPTVQTYWSQEFSAPNSSDVDFDKVSFEFDTATTASQNFEYIFSVYNTDSNGRPVPGTPLTSYSEVVSLPIYGGAGPRNITTATADFTNVTLDPTKNYTMVFQAVTNVNIGGMGIRYRSPSGILGRLFQGTSLSVSNPVANTNLGLQAFFVTPSPRAVSNVSLSTPAGNYNEASGIQINLAGAYEGTGLFSVSNPDQSGNTSLKTQG